MAKNNSVSRPSNTIELTNEREWMLTEKGFDKALELLRIPIEHKGFLLTKSYEVQKVVRQPRETPQPEKYERKKSGFHKNPISDHRVRSFPILIKAIGTRKDPL